MYSQFAYVHIISAAYALVSGAAQGAGVQGGAPILQLLCRVLLQFTTAYLSTNRPCFSCTKGILLRSVLVQS
jgi:hypothetical protein